jgi:hypothetical protein
MKKAFAKLANGVQLKLILRNLVQHKSTSRKFDKILIEKVVLPQRILKRYSFLLNDFK